MPAAKKVVEAADVVDDVKDLVEDSVELIEDGVSWITRNPKQTALVAATIGALSGALACFLIVNSRLQRKYQAIADEQIEDVKQHYSILNKKGEHGDLEALASPYALEQGTPEAVEEAEKVIEREGYRSYDKVQPAVEVPVSAVTQVIRQESVQVVERNVFESDDADTYFDFEEELKRREEKPEQPFVITKDEFDENETDYDQQQLTYYDGDDVLADDKDAPLNDKDGIMGYENLLRFGHGSGDPKIVYIRNPKLGVDFEVSHSDGKYAKEVLDFDDGELKHSDRRPIRKFRLSDE